MRIGRIFMYFEAREAYYPPMDTSDSSGSLLPAELMAQVEAMAAIEHRPARDMLREAVEHYVQIRRPFVGFNGTDGAQSERSPKEAAERMLSRRGSHPLPAGMSIRELTTFGRA